ncbi:MAG: hypothetical protein NTU47_04205 [Ignavibacteriales bacterium]|nr:hypothetical protein [Ignavibacteriales bacterium]
MLFELRFTRVHYIDNNRHSVRIMNGMRAYPSTDKLEFGDWIKVLPEFKNYFAAILSDLTSGNIEYSDRMKFYYVVNQSLVRGGIFIDKVLTHGKKKKKLKHLDDKYRTLPLNLLHINHFSCEYLFDSELLDAEYRVDSSRFYDLLEERFSDPVLRKFAFLSRRVTPRDCIWWYGKPWSDLENEYCPGLRRVHSFDERLDSPYAKGLKIFVSIKK